jgi:peptidyl-dipeptidase Dcp
MSPFARPSSLPYQAPAFDRVTDADYEPAIEEGMKSHLAEIEAIADQTAPPTFDDTIAAMERSGQALRRASRVFYAMTSSNTNDTLQAIEERLAPKLAAHDDAIHLNPRLFARVEAVHAARDALDAEARHLVERVHRGFVRAGARLSQGDQTTLRALNEEESSLSTQFDKLLLAATKTGALVSGDPAELGGLSEGEMAAAAQAARGRQLEGRWVLPLQNTTQQPALVSLQDRATRRRLFEASTRRAERGDANDTRAVVARLAELRARKARLLGYPTYAAYALEDQMAGTPERATALLADLAPAAVAKAGREAARMEALVRGTPGNGAELGPWDWPFYAEQVRKAEYALDDEQVKPYLELDRVLRDGVFFAAGKLYGLSFVERRDLPVYHPDVRVFEVFDAGGEPLGLFYADYFERDNKAGGAWMSSFGSQSRLLGTSPVVVNVCNFTKPAPGQPALLTFDAVRTMFHEFGHALHGLLSDVTYPSLSGTSVPRDFVEFPSQFNEHWASHPEVFASYARHHQTGAPMPADLVAKIERSRKFNQGYATTEYLAAAFLDMAWHTRQPEAPAQDVDRSPKGAAANTDVEAFEAEALRRFGVDVALVPPRYRTTYFAHIWGGGYAASYYAYLWAEVLDHDAYQWFVEHGGLTRANGQRFREMILSRGDTQEMASLYRAFRGRDPSVEPLLEERGLGARAE